MRVLMLSFEYPPHISGGLGNHVYYLSTNLVSLGHQVTVVTSRQNGTAEEEIRQGVKVLRVAYHPEGDMPQQVANFNRAASTLDPGHFDVIHAHDWLVKDAALIYAARYPLVVTIHATEYGRNHGLKTPMHHFIHRQEWELAQKARELITCSRYMQQEVFQLFQKDSTVIPNGVKIFPPQEVTPFSHPCVFFIGRLVYEKGVQTVIKALPQVLKYYPDCRFLIGGRGYYEGQLRQQARELGVEGNVFFLGFLAEYWRRVYTSQSLVTVVPSLYEPFGIVALEAMAEGTPVIVANTGGLAEIVNHNVDGLKFPPGNSSALADQLLRNLHDWEVGGILRETLAKNALVKLKREYDWEQIARQTAEIYRKSAESRHEHE